jgi:hypothetical protein
MLYVTSNIIRKQLLDKTKPCKKFTEDEANALVEFSQQLCDIGI